MILKEKHYKCIKFILEGRPYTEIAKLVPCARQTIYDWLENEAFKAELDKCRAEIYKQAQNKVLDKVNTYLDKVEEIAFTSESDSVRLNALQLLIERSLGKATTKIEQKVDKKEDKQQDVADIDDMLAEIEADNVIDLEEKKAK